MKRSLEQAVILQQVSHIAEGLAKTFAPFCEVVVHDLLDPKHAVLAIHNNLSDRQVGHPATELGLARILDPDYEPVIANYPNQFSDGRLAKSTSIGIKDSKGQYIAALCMNIDLTLFHGFQSAMSQFIAVDADGAPKESLGLAGADAIRRRIDQFAARLAMSPRTLKTRDRKVLMQKLKESGLLEVRRSMEIIAEHLGVSRAAVYTYAK